MTPNQKHLAEQESPELDSAKLLTLVDQLCRAIAIEQEANRLSRAGCKIDCAEYGGPLLLLPLAAALPDNLTRVVSWA